MTTNELWKYSTTFDRVRLARLTALKDFGEVVAHLQSSIRDIQLRSCKGREVELQACVQPVFTVSVDGDAFDAFFNSPVGYRASYLKDVNQGLLANLVLVESLLERLLSVAQQQCIPELTAIDVRASLLATSCKVWIHEDDFPFQSPTRDLAIEPWLQAAVGERKATWGLCAPTGTRLEVKGALLDPSGHEIVPLKKILRRYDIQRFGFS
jgi:hypothetical protein